MNTELTTPLVRQALHDADILLDKSEWVRIETREFGAVILQFGRIHSNGMHESPNSHIVYQWDMGNITRIIHSGI